MPASNGLAAPRRAPATKRSRPIATPRGKPSRANWSSTSPAAGRHPTTANHRLRWRRRNRAPHLRTTSSPHGRRASQRAAIIAGTEISGVTARPLAGTTSHTAPTHAARLYPESPSPEPTNDDIAGPPESGSAGMLSAVLERAVVSDAADRATPRHAGVPGRRADRAGVVCVRTAVGDSLPTADLQIGRCRVLGPDADVLDRYHAVVAVTAVVQQVDGPGHDAGSGQRLSVDLLVAGAAHANRGVRIAGCCPAVV